MIKKSFICLSVATSVILLTACGGSDSSSDNDTSTITGQFIDGIVEGADYECSSGAIGTTNSNGEYTCNKDDTVTFTVAGIELGTVAAKALITPYDLKPNNEESAVNIAQLLQTLDDDGDPSNGIKLDNNQNRFQNLKTYIQTSETADSINFSNADFDSVVSEIMGETLVEATTAQDHMDETIASLAEIEPEVADTEDSINDSTNSTVDSGTTSDNTTTVDSDSSSDNYEAAEEIFNRFADWQGNIGEYTIDDVITSENKNMFNSIDEDFYSNTTLISGASFKDSDWYGMMIKYYDSDTEIKSYMETDNAEFDGITSWTNIVCEDDILHNTRYRHISCRLSETNYSGFTYGPWPEEIIDGTNEKYRAEITILSLENGKFYTDTIDVSITDSLSK